MMECRAVNNLVRLWLSLIATFFFSRLLLPALHFNANGDRQIARTSHGEARYAVSYPWFRKGGWVVRPIKENPSYGEPFCFCKCFLWLYICHLCHCMWFLNDFFSLQKNMHQPSWPHWERNTQDHHGPYKRRVSSCPQLHLAPSPNRRLRRKRQSAFILNVILVLTPKLFN